MPSPKINPPTVSPGAYASSAPGVPVRPEPAVVNPLCWGAVLAGAVAALSIHLLVTLFGVGLGLQIVEPATAQEGGQKFSIGVGIAWSVAALLALWAGGWVAGRLTPESNRRLGGIHGFLVWSLATVVTLFALGSGAGMLAGTVARITGRTIGAAAEAVAPAAQAGGEAIARFAQENSNLLQSFTRELVPGAASGEETAQQQAAAAAARASREISWALVRLFSAEPAERDARRAELVRAVDEHTPLDETQANQRVDQMIATYDRVQADLKQMADRAETKAREVGEKASDYATHVAVWTFVAFIVGAIAASLGGASGARARREHDAGALA
jgi:hypothetical protein